MATAQISSTIPRKMETLGELVGNTPLLGITYSYKNSVHTLFAKAEHLNLTGSIKDRMAFHVLRCAYQQGKLHAGDTIVEATSGNTGISLAAIGCSMGHPVVIYMPDWMSRERVKLIESYGARVIGVSHADGGFLGSIRKTELHAGGSGDVYLPQQFENEANVQAHAETTGPEILAQLRSIGLVPHAFVAGVGTGGTVMGLLRCLRRHNLATSVHPVEPAESPTLSTGYKVGSHRIQGISDEFIPKIVNLPALDDVLPVSDGDSILMAQKLATLGLAVGISSGCNFLAAVIAQQREAQSSTVVTVFPDDNKKYLSTDLFKEEPARAGYLSPEIELLEFRAVGRL